MYVDGNRFGGWCSLGMKYLLGGSSNFFFWIDSFFIRENEEAYFLRERERENLIHHLVTFFSPNYFQTFAFKIKREANNAVSNRLERSKVNI